MFLFGFSGGFYMFLLGSTGYESFIGAFITVLLMLFAQISYDPFHAASGLTWLVSNLLLLAYLVSVVVVLLNLLIAMMSTSYSRVWEEAEGQVLLCYAQAIVRMEKSITTADRVKQFKKLQNDGNKYEKSRLAWRDVYDTRYKAERTFFEWNVPLATRLVALCECLANCGIMALAPLIFEPQHQSQSPLASNIRTKCATLEDGVRWESRRTQTNSDQQAALNARVESLKAVVDQQTAQNKEQTTLIKEQTTLIKEQAELLREQTAVINELRNVMLTLVGQREPWPATVTPRAPSTGSARNAQNSQ